MVAGPLSGERGYPGRLDSGDFDGPGEDWWWAAVVDEGPDPGLDDARDELCPDEADLPVLGFGLTDAGSTMRPGVSLHMLAERSVGSLAGMTEDEVIELIAAARRLRSRAEWLQAQATAEFAARRWDAGPAKGPERRPDGRIEFKGRAAEFAADEIAFRLAEDQGAAQEDMELSLALRDRLPRMDAALKAGDVDLHRCRIVGQETSALSDENARLADEMLAPDAAGLKYGALRRRARKIAMMLDPDTDRERKERATRRNARVEKFPEKSGNHAFAGRELPAEEALACEAYVKGMARHLKAHGVPGSLREIEVMVYLDLCQGRDPRARVPGGDHAQDSQPPGSESGRQGDDGGVGDDTGGSAGDGPGKGSGLWPFSPPGPGKPGGRAPFPAKINLLVPAGSLLGWSAMPGEAGREIIGPQALRNLVQAASHHPATRWCVTLIGTDRAAIAHGCARGQHAWDPGSAATPGSKPDSGRGVNNSETAGRPGEDAASRDGPSWARDGTGASVSTPAQQAQLAELLGRLKPDLAPIATGTCNHAHREDGYRPSRKLQDMVRARNATCPAPGCGASSAHCDIDHTKPWPDGNTDECNLGAPCRHHHRAKQAPGWNLEQPQPGVFRWLTPTGHTYQVGPTRYDT